MPIPADTAAKMLYTLRNDVIKKLSPEDTVEVAEKIDNPELRDALVKHSVGASN